MNRQSARATLFVLLLSVTAPRAWAWECMPITVAEALGEADAVFAGGVVGKDVPEGGSIDGADSMLVRFDVMRVWKGPKKDTLTLTTTRSEFSYRFEVGRAYLVYASGSPDALNTGPCWRTRLLSGAQDDLDGLGEGEAPSAESSDK